MAHLLRLNDLSVEEIHSLLDRAEQINAMSDEGWLEPNHTLVANLFYEPSTRTRFSFETAERRLGFQVLNFSSKTSSAQKGESLYDTVRTMESLGAKAVVIRHQQEAYYEQLRTINIPILNAGDGTGNHPTQALLDLLTLREAFTHLKGRTVAIIGDLRYSRVANADAEVLQRFGCRVLLSSPKEWSNSALPGTYVTVDQAVEEADAVIMLRIQHERHQHTMKMSKEQYHARYGLTQDRALRMKPDSIIMHPGPINRGVEMDDALVECSRSRYFKQIRNGVSARMAALEWTLNSTATSRHAERVPEML
ncbi:aspartate carbamoyltransferase catalytic subunit [Sporolactobacillus inulinus]|uniref:Aspartate carbamoyltransferase n=2 Tax=Sporolactobacillus inulinus TaxID=2078 RepID=A0A0U1QLV5_9BACL|nr:aspartate carbamoyltransferase catalytic subunit [Sporolactobacillus inulinus]KLI01794.1 aspartate carbamoyltransferase catalytic subunit [Sporolactobacillus inulinus CASD]GEB76419.1 aspartate carbamoyltransferase [Sporolactobacillus inulinus]